MPLPIVESCFETRTYGGDITLIFEPHVIPNIRCNMWHVRGRDRDLLLDSHMHSTVAVQEPWPVLKE